MKRYRELKIIGSANEQEKLINLIEHQLSNGWTRDRENEEKLRARTGNASCITFACSKTKSRPIAGVSFIVDEDKYLCVSTVFSKDRNVEFSVDDYNAVLEEFLTQFVEPTAKELDIRIVTSPGEQTIEDIMSPEMSNLLKQFSAAANKSNGGTHILDEGRFINFIIQAHNEGSLLEEDELSGLLIDDGWPEASARELSTKYGFGREVLKQYSKASA